MTRNRQTTHPEPESWELSSPAKLNLSLRVVGVRPDGYHALESLFAYCNWRDGLRLEAIAGTQNQISVCLQGPHAPSHLPDEQNLAVRAYHFAHQHLGPLPAVHLTLTKNIPAGAGLGGGSGNAAAILRWAWAQSGQPLPQPNAPIVGEVRAALGADCYPIFDGRARIWRGTGDVPGPLLKPKHDLYVLVVFPQCFLSTARIFSALTPTSGPAARAATAWDEVTGGPNDLQAPAKALSPRVAALLQSMEAACRHTGKLADDAIKVQMTGSGAACFALFHSIERAREASQHPDLVQLPQHVGPVLWHAWD